MKRETESGIIVDLQPVVAVEILENIPGRPVVHVTQETIRTYPGRRMKNDKTTGLFTGAEEGQKFSSTRHCLIVIPAGTTLGTVADTLKKFPEGVIQRVVTNNIEDILTSGDKWALENPEITNVTLEILKDKYETRDKEGNRYSRGQMRVNAESGVVVDASLPEEFSRNFYQNTYVEDINKCVVAEEPAKLDLVEKSVSSLTV